MLAPLVKGLLSPFLLSGEERKRQERPREERRRRTKTTRQTCHVCVTTQRDRVRDVGVGGLTFTQGSPRDGRSVSLNSKLNAKASRVERKVRRTESAGDRARHKKLLRSDGLAPTSCPEVGGEEAPHEKVAYRKGRKGENEQVTLLCSSHVHHRTISCSRSGFCDHIQGSEAERLANSSEHSQACSVEAKVNLASIMCLEGSGGVYTALAQAEEQSSASDLRGEGLWRTLGRPGLLGVEILRSVATKRASIQWSSPETPRRHMK